MSTSKPSGAYRIDWSNPLTDGLIGCWLLDGKGSGVLFEDLTGNNHGTVIGSSIKNVVTEGNISTRFTGDNNTDRINLGSIDSTNPLSLYGSEGLSIASRLNLTSLAHNNYPRIIDKSTSGGGANGWICSISGNGEFNLSTYLSGVSYESNSQTVIPFGVNINVGFSAKQGEKNAIFYFDGQKETGSLANNILNFPSTTCNAAIGNWNHTTDRNWYGDLHYLYVFNILKNDDFFKSIARDPYQFLKPVRTVKGAVYAALFPASEPPPEDGKIFFGSLNVDNLKFGNSQVDKVMVGSTQVWP